MINKIIIFFLIVFAASINFVVYADSNSNIIDEEQSISVDTQNIVMNSKKHKVEYWQYSKNTGNHCDTPPKYFGSDFLGEVSSFFLNDVIDVDETDPDGAFCIAPGENICKVAAEVYNRKYGSRGIHPRAFYLRIPTTHNVVRIWDREGSAQCNILGSVEEECLHVRLFEKDISCGYGSTKIWNLETSQQVHDPSLKDYISNKPYQLPHKIDTTCPDDGEQES